MLTFALWIGLLGHPAAPPLVTPGMTPAQVQAVLGKSASTILASGGTSNLSITEIYFDSRLSVSYQGGKVVSVVRHKE